MNGPSTPPKNLRHERKRLKRPIFKVGDIISFITLNGKEGFGEVVNKMPIVNKSLPQKWRILNVNSYKTKIVPENKMTFVHIYSSLFN